MPIPAQEKLRILQEVGLDANKYWLDDAGNIVDAPSESVVGAGIKSALYNAPRTVTGFGGAALGAAGAGALGLPSGPGAVATGVLGATAGGAAGSALGELIQNSLYPESWRFSQEMREVRNPGATKVADLASQAVLMRPSFKMAKAAATAPLDFIRSAGQVSPNNAAALGNMAIGGALGGGMALGQGGSTADVLEALAAGTLLSQPTKLGQKLSRDVFMPWKPQPTWNQATAGMREAFNTRVGRANKANQEAAATENARRKEEFEAAVARGEAPMPVDPVQAREYQPAPIEAELGVSPTELWWDKWRQVVQGQMASDFNVRDVVTDGAGTPVAGRMTPRANARSRGAIDVSTYSYADTPPHEAMHKLFEDALNYGSPREQAFTQRMLNEMGLRVEDVGGRKRIVGSMEEFVGPLPENTPRGEEDLTQTLGEDVVRRAVDPAKYDTIRQAMADFADYYLKNRVTPASARRMLSGRLMYGRGTAPSLGKGTGAVAGALATEEVKPTETVENPLAVEQARKAELDRAEAAQLKAENDAREARRADVEAAFAAQEKDAARARMVQNMENLPTSPKRVQLGEDMAKFADTGGEMPIGELSLAEPDQSYDLGNVKPEEATPGTDVTRPVNRTYSGESIPAAIRRGKVMRQNLEESPEDLELRRIEDRLSGRDRSKYQPFSTDFEKELANARPFKIQVSKDGRMSGNDIRSAVARLNPTEQELLKEAGLENYLRQVARPTAAELKTWAEANVPRVEVKELTADSPTNAIEQKAAALQHELDTRFPGGPTRENLANSEYIKLHEAHAAAALEASRSRQNRANTDNDSATAAYDTHGINPRQLADMPGAVDLLVRIPRRVRKSYTADEQAQFERDYETGEISDDSEITHEVSGGKVVRDKARYSSLHYPKSGDNLLAHLRAYEHTMPNGERVLRVFEVQSDWAQERRKWTADREKHFKQDAEGNWYSTELGAARGYKVKTKEELFDYMEKNGFVSRPTDHPLLAHHQRLALKAAIEHARKLGIKKVVVDDAETAMLTEGHDKYASGNVTIPNTPENLRYAKQNWDSDGLTITPDTITIKNETQDTLERIASQRNGKISKIISQERGMRQAYEGSPMVRDKEGNLIRLGFETAEDANAYLRGFRKESAAKRGEYSVSRGQLHEMMRDMSGEGVKVELGEHRNAFDQYDNRRESIQARLNDLEAWRRSGMPDDAYTEQKAELEVELRKADETHGRRPRPDLIFRNPDGTPKTQSTGFAYDVSAVQARRDTGEPFSYAGRKYQRFGPGRPTSSLPDADRKGFSPFESASQKAERSSNPVVRTVGRALSELFPAQRAMQGKYRALPEAFSGLNEKDADLLYEIMIEEDRTGTSLAGTVPARMRPNYRRMRDTLVQMHKDRIAAKHYRESGVVPASDPTYFPNVVDPSIRKTMADEPDTARYKQLKQEFLDFNKDYQMRRKGKTAAEASVIANAYFNRFVGTLSKQPVEGAFDFGAVSLPAGSKLPDNWLHADPAAAMRQYVRDWSRSRTFHDNVMTNEDVMAGLGSETYRLNGKTVPVSKRVTPVIKNEDIRFLLNEAAGVNAGSTDKVTGAIGRAASTMWLANPITRSVDIATPVFKAAGMIPPSKIPGMIANLRSLGRSIEHAHDTGWVKEDGNTIVGEVLGAGEQFTNAVDKFSRGLSKYTGSEWLENFGRGLSQNLGEYVARTHMALAKSGDKRATEFLQRVAKNWDTLSEAELGTRIGQLFQGRYDATNLPRWLADSPAAPFFSLARWNIEQWNNFREFAIEPAKKGDIAPLISMLVAGLAGGVGVKEIREALGGRKSKVATIKEILEAPEGSAKYVEGVRYLGNLAQLTGTMGIVSEMGNWALDIASKDKPQGLSMPALEVTSDIIPRLVAAGVAIADGQDPLTVLAAVGRDIGNEHMSAYRFLETNAGRFGLSETAAEDLADANARRDLRVGKRLRGETVRPAVGLPIDYSRAEERQVEKTRGRDEMIERAKELRTDILAEPDRDRRAERLRSAASSRPSYLPSPTSDPKGFREQLDFVSRTQGPEAARRLRERYLRDKRLADTRRLIFK